MSNTELPQISTAYKCKRKRASLFHMLLLIIINLVNIFFITFLSLFTPPLFFFHYIMSSFLNVFARFSFPFWRHVCAHVFLHFLSFSYFFLYSFLLFPRFFTGASVVDFGNFIILSTSFILSFVWYFSVSFNC